MPTAKRSVRLRRRRALSVFFLSVCLLLNSYLPAAFARQSLNDYRRAGQSDSPSADQTARQSDAAGGQSVSRPRRIDPDRQYDDDGPTVRVALVTDVTDVTISSSSGFIVLRSGTRRDAERIARRPLRFEIRQQLVRQTAAPSRESESPYQRLSQLVAVEGDHVLATSDDRLIITAANTAEPPPQPKDERAEPRKEDSARDNDYLEQQRRDAEALWGTRAKPGRNDAPAVTVNPALGGTSSVRAASCLRVGGKEYRGEMQLILNARGRINVVNALPMEQYLRGVVPMELSPGAYPAVEALKAQAVAARTYALAHRNQSREADFDLRDDTRSQVYGGLTAERDLTNRAVEETRGVVALTTNDEGRLVPIDALYTANCGGRTENNEVIFGGKPLSYLRSVVCQPDRQTLAGHDIVSNRTAEFLVESEGRQLARDLALLQVLGFLLPRKASNTYLRGTPDDGEMRNWTARLSEMVGHDAPRMTKDVTRLGGFALLLASALYGEGRASLLLTPADVDYLLAGLAVKEATPDVRANLAMLLRDRILQWPTGLDGRAPVTRATVIETLARSVLLKSRATQTGTLSSSIASIKVDTARAAEQGRLLLTPRPAAKTTTAEVASTKTAPAPQANADSNKTKAKTIASNRSRLKVTTQPRAKRPSDALAKNNDARSSTRAGQEMTAKEVIAYSNAASFDRENPASRAARDTLDGLEVEPSAWLFRSFGDTGYPVDRLTLVGGERVVYHVNSKGDVDFIEAVPSERGASSDRFSSVAQWQERVSAEEMQRRLNRASVNVGAIESITPVAFTDSNRVIEIEVVGDDATARLRGPQLRSVLGLKENLFVVDREMDGRGRVTGFVFTGRGWGHGVGMCQVGAYGLARDGYSYTQILQKYYTGVKVQKIY